MTPAEQAARSFCSVLFANLDESLADHLVPVLTWPGPRVQWLSVGDPDAIATAVRAADDRGRSEPSTAVYLSMSPRYPTTERTKPDGTARRGTAADCSALLGVWADLDWASEAHTGGKRLPDDEAAVRRILDACGLTPTTLWRSGHGLQAYWAFAEPIVFDDAEDPAAARAEAQALLRNWNITLAIHAHRLGRWAVDSTFDITRVLRVPGTTNRKIPGDLRRVELVHTDETAVYDPSDIVDHTAGERYLRDFSAMSSVPADAEIMKVDLPAVWAMVNSPEYRSRRYMPEWLDALLENDVLQDSSRLVQVWRNGHPSGDDSSTDASLARHTADLGYDPRDAVEIIMCYRLRVRRKLEKVNPQQRTDYLQRTVGKSFAESAKAKARSAQLTAEAQAEADAAPIVPDGATIGDDDDRTPGGRAAAEHAQRALQVVGGPRGLGGAIARELDERIAAVSLGEPDPTPEDMPDLAIEVDAEQASPAPGPRPDPGLPDDGDPGPGPGVPDGADVGAPPPEISTGPVADHADDGGTDTADPADAPSAGSDQDSGDAGELEDVGHPVDDGHDDPADARDRADDGHADGRSGEDGGEAEGNADGGTYDPQDPEDQPSIADDETGGADGDGADDGGDDAAPDPDDAEPTPQRPITGLRASAWGTRTDWQHRQLTALTETLLGDFSRAVWIWRLQQRGRGAKAERRIVFRLHRDFKWPTNTPPHGYVPGQPFPGGWWPAATFGKLGGWIRVVDIDLGLPTAPVKADDFDDRFGRILQRLWEADDSGGALGTVTRDQLLNYLLDFPPLADWQEGAQQGMPVIMQDVPLWRLDSPFAVLVRWADFGQHVRGATGLNTSPAMLADMAEMAGARPVRTATQNGRWRSLRREYFTETEWQAILQGGEHAALMRSERHGMHVAGGTG